MQSMKETAANVSASAKAGMEKTKAVAQEKVEKLSAHDPVQKQMATEKKEDRMAMAEQQKREAKEQNAAAKQAARATGGYDAHYTTSGTGAGTDPYHPGSRTHSATDVPGYPTGGHQMSAMPGHGTGQPYGGSVAEGVERAHPSGLAGETAGHNTNVEGGGYGVDNINTTGQRTGGHGHTGYERSI